MSDTYSELAIFFNAVEDALKQNQAAFNQADPYNANHGDHMVEIFQVAAHTAGDKSESDLAETMAYAGKNLLALDQNGSAQVYGQGLVQFGEQFRQHNISLEDLVFYIKGHLSGRDGEKGDNAGNTLKALVAGLTAWKQVVEPDTGGKDGLNMGVLFELGIIYMQAKQRGGSRAEILADAAASASPLSSEDYRYQSGKLAIQALLEAMSQ